MSTVSTHFTTILKMDFWGKYLRSINKNDKKYNSLKRSYIFIVQRKFCDFLNFSVTNKMTKYIRKLFILNYRIDTWSMTQTLVTSSVCLHLLTLLRLLFVISPTFFFYPSLPIPVMFLFLFCFVVFCLTTRPFIMFISSPWLNPSRFFRKNSLTVNLTQDLLQDSLRQYVYRPFLVGFVSFGFRHFVLVHNSKVVTRIV